MASTKQAAADRPDVPRAVRLRDARLSAALATVLRYVLGTVAASILINLASAEWGWSSLWLVLTVVVWTAGTGWLVSLPFRSPLRETAIVGLILLLALGFGATALANSAFALDPGFTRFMLIDAAIMAVLNLTLSVLWPRWLRMWDGMSFSFAAAWVAVLAAEMPVWLRAALMVLIGGAYLVGFLSLYPPTAPAVGRIGARLRRCWVWLVTEHSGRAANRRRRHPHDSPGRRQSAPIGSRTHLVRRPRTMRRPGSGGTSDG